MKWAEFKYWFYHNCAPLNLLSHGRCKILQELLYTSLPRGEQSLARAQVGNKLFPAPNIEQMLPKGKHYSSVPSVKLKELNRCEEL